MYFHEWYIQLYGSRRAVSQSLFCGSWQSGSLRCFSRTCQNANFSTPVLNSLIQWVLELCVQVLQRQVFLTFIDLQLRNTSSTIPLFCSKTCSSLFMPARPWEPVQLVSASHPCTSYTSENFVQIPIHRVFYKPSHCSALCPPSPLCKACPYFS